MSSTSSPPPGRPDHRCAGYRSDDEKWSLVRDFLGEARDGDDLLYVGADDDRFVAVAEGTDWATMRTADLDSLYRGCETLSPEAPLAIFGADDAGTPTGGAAGRSRAVADLTGLADEPTLAALIDHEARVDEAMIDEPLSGLCLYDRRVVDDERWVAVASTHAVAVTDAPPFRLARRATTLRLEGELDVESEAPLTRVLTALGGPVREVALDRLEFLGVGGARSLVHWLTTRPPGDVVLTGVTPTMRRVLELFDLDRATLV